MNKQQIKKLNNRELLREYNFRLLEDFGDSLYGNRDKKEIKKIKKEYNLLEQEILKRMEQS